MNLSISPLNNVSFGMAKFSKEGMRLAQQAGAGEYTEFNNEEYYKRTGLTKPPFAKYIAKELPAKKQASQEAIENVEDVMVKHGAGNNARTNARFAKQYMHPSTQRYVTQLYKRQPDVHDEILKTARVIFDSNWNNPELSKGETKRLLDAVKSTMSDAEYVKWSGIIEESDAIPDREIKQKPLRAKKS